MKRGEAGFTITEMLIASMIMMAVTGTVFHLINPAHGTFQAQPEIADMQQRMRVAIDSLRRDLVMAGAGSYVGASAGALNNYFAPMMPYRIGNLNSDPKAGVFYRPDAISIMYVPPTPSQTTIRDPMPQTSTELKVQQQDYCPGGKQNDLCDFEEGMRVIIFDPSGAWDAITITSVQDAALHLGHDGQLSVPYGTDAKITQVKTATYYLKSDTATNTYQLRFYDGYQTDLPVVDNVVKLEFEYFGDPVPPQLLPNKALTDVNGPWTTYGPKPPPLGVDNVNDTWLAGENCTFFVDANGQHAPRLATLAAGVGQVKLDPAILTDGPFCPDNTKQEPFDADLLRIRRVRVKLRVQVGLQELRGPAGLLFVRGGTSTSGERFVPDQEIAFDVTPRNMNLGR
jgi:hypothetical protein